jgi:hypothetical protein
MIRPTPRLRRVLMTRLSGATQETDRGNPVGGFPGLFVLAVRVRRSGATMLAVRVRRFAAATLAVSVRRVPAATLSLLARETVRALGGAVRRMGRLCSAWTAAAVG